MEVKKEMARKGVGILEEAARATPGLSSSRDIVRYLDSWDKNKMVDYLKAYQSSDWDIVYDFTDDLNGSAFSRAMVRGQLADVLQEKLGTGGINVLRRHGLPEVL